jgi:hypothetical protein
VNIAIPARDRGVPEAWRKVTELMTIDEEPRRGTIDHPEGVATGPAERRRRAHDAAVAEVSAPLVRADEAAIGLRTYGQGRVALALGGYFDPAAIARLRSTLGDLHRLGTEELIVDLSQLGPCPPALARTLAQLRMQRLVHGARVEVHHPPQELAAVLGHGAADAFTITEP